ncbi:HD domain-containing protein [Candidatus Nomurabacteria bacterium]|nr:HD domain-containing protein [Candidatus Kaiserbacteria bacterium]MCB9814083.1 HD domain-containing protein [Candidatus Nomurabacteria bacterium]
MQKIDFLKEKVKELYDEHNEKLLFHGWHHVQFVSKKAVEFSESIGADTELVEVAALVHDLNYVVQENSEPEAGSELRAKLLTEAGYSGEEIMQIESVVSEAHTGRRGHIISEEGKALSDADSLFKILPITPILFSSKYITENKVDIYKLSNMIVSEQTPLLAEGIYFYTDLAKERYLKWAKINLDLWTNVQESLQDEDVKEMLAVAKERGIL